MPTKTKAPAVQVHKVPVGDLRAYPNNPRRGNIEVIKESLSTLGQYRPIIVRKSDMMIGGGNHTWKATIELGWPTIDVVFAEDLLGHEVSDDELAKIVLIDNRSNDLATYDTEVLARVLESVSSPTGTGYDEDTMKSIIDAVANSDSDALIDAVRPTVALVHGEPDPFDDVDMPDAKVPVIDSEAQPFEGDPDEEEGVEFDDVMSQLQGAFALNENLDLIGDNYYGIPDLKPSMLLDVLPSPLGTWGGKDATPDDGITTWVWNYGLAGYSGLPVDRAILSFFTYDEKFDGWFDHPAFYTAKLMNAGLKMAIVPDFSYYNDWPRVAHIWNHYRGNWLGRFFQECGIKVIPRLQFDDMTSLDFCTVGIPVGCPILACSLQNFTKGEGSEAKEKDQALVAECVTEGLKKIQPKQFLVYSGKQGRAVVEDRVQPSCDVVFVENYAAVRRGVVFDKKEGLGSTGKQNKAVKKLKAKRDADTAEKESAEGAD